MTTQAPPSNLLPLSPEQMRLQAATTDFTPAPSWPGFLGRAESAARRGGCRASPGGRRSVHHPDFGIATGNARRVAEAA